MRVFASIVVFAGILAGQFGLGQHCTGSDLDQLAKMYRAVRSERIARDGVEYRADVDQMSRAIQDLVVAERYRNDYRTKRQRKQVEEAAYRMSEDGGVEVRILYRASKLGVTPSELLDWAPRALPAPIERRTKPKVANDTAIPNEGGKKRDGSETKSIYDWPFHEESSGFTPAEKELIDAGYSEDAVQWFDRMSNDSQQTSKVLLRLVSATRAFEEADAAIRQIRPNDLEGERATLRSLKKIMDEMLETNLKPLLMSNEALHVQMRDYKEALVASVPNQLTAAKAMREFAKREPRQIIKEDYLTWAEIFEKQAAKTQASVADYEKQLANVEDQLEFAKAIKLQIVRVRPLLYTIPEGADATEFREQLRKYIEQYERYRQQLRALHRAIDAVERKEENDATA